MKYGRMVLVATAAALAGSAALIQAQAMKAHADIKGDGVTGRVELVERRQGREQSSMSRLPRRGLKPGLHGVHLHAVGQCEAPIHQRGRPLRSRPGRQHRP